MELKAPSSTPAALSKCEAAAPVQSQFLQLQICFTPANTGARENPRPGSHRPGPVGIPGGFLGFRERQGGTGALWVPAAPPSPNVPPGGCCPQPSHQICQLGAPLSCHIHREHGSTSEDNGNYDFCFPLNIFSNKYRRKQDYHKQKWQQKVLSGRGSEKTAPNILFLLKKLNIIYKSIFHKITSGGYFFCFVYIIIWIFLTGVRISHQDNPPKQKQFKTSSSLSFGVEGGM